MLIDSKNMYKEAYTEYITTGVYGDFYGKVAIQFVLIDSIISILKDKINLKKYFSIMLEFSGEVTQLTSMAINDYIASRCNGYLSMNALLPNDNSWKCYYANNGQYIQNVHDYTEIDFRKNKKRERTIHN